MACQNVVGGGGYQARIGFARRCDQRRYCSSPLGGIQRGVIFQHPDMGLSVLDVLGDVPFGLRDQVGNESLPRNCGSQGGLQRHQLADVRFEFASGSTGGGARPGAATEDVSVLKLTGH
ncbi:hypothetical protein [Mycobacterium camsae]|uniref:hypothetical protein n=1 Tax=Mycobacterium gordonae TaxID=1778 RepID=UPI00197F7062|nr:hypothetical protein [Mycobacterium gordonae]